MRFSLSIENKHLKTAASWRECEPLTSCHGDYTLNSCGQAGSYSRIYQRLVLFHWINFFLALSVKPPVQRLSLISTAVQSLRRQRHRPARPTSCPWLTSPLCMTLCVYVILRMCVCSLRRLSA